jgi:hypothetical protein
MDTLKFKVKWGTYVKIITGIILLIIAIAEYHLVVSLIYSINGLLLFLACCIPVIFIYFALESPSFIEIDTNGLTLHKRKGKLIIRYSQITSVSHYKPDKSEIRYFGSGGVFGFIGRFSNANIGAYQSYVGDYAQAFLIQTKENKKYVLSCENRDLVINTIKTNIKQ